MDPETERLLRSIEEEDAAPPAAYHLATPTGTYTAGTFAELVRRVLLTRLERWMWGAGWSD